MNTLVDRRRLLLGMAAAATGAALAGQAGSAPLSNTTENETLLRLGDELAAAEAEMVQATAAYHAVLREWWRKWPSAPAALELPYGDHYSLERGLDGAAITADGRHANANDRVRSLNTPEDFRRQIAHLDNAVKRRRPRHPLTAAELMEAEATRATLSDKLAIAIEYEDQRTQILALSGYPAAHRRQSVARHDLLQLVTQIMAEPETTMTGVMIKAQAVHAWGKAPYHAFEVGAADWPQQLVTSLLRIAGGAA